jgi:hypothetical protein
MKRIAFWSVFAVLALAALGAAWFLDNFDRMPTTRWERPGKEARRDPYLALERLGERMGRPVARIGSAHALERLAPMGALLLDRGRRLPLTPQRIDALFKWVEQGGYLIVAAEGGSVDDPVLERLGVTWGEVPKKQSEDAASSSPGAYIQEGEAGQCTPPPVAEDELSDTVPIRLPSEDRTLRLKNPGWNRNRILLASAPEPAWQVGGVLLHYAYGSGQVTVLEDFGFLTNWDIGDYDHAELAWALIQRYGPTGELRLATRLEVPTLWAWLAESAWMALASGGVLTAAWLWAIAPRFGGTLPSAEPSRRSLAEHLAAVGRAVWRERGLSHWSDTVRQDLRETLARCHPQLAVLPGSEQAEALARIGGIPPEQLAAVLEAGGEPSPQAFTEAMRAAQRLEQAL